MYIWIVLLQICINHSHTRTQWTCGLWDVKQMIFVHDYLKLMDKIWPLSALHLHHRRTSTNDRSKQVTHCLQLWTWILLSILIHSNSIQLNIWKQFNKLISNKNDSYVCCSYSAQNNNLNCNQVYYDKHYINVNDLSTKHIFNFKNIKDSFLELYTLSMIGQLNIVLVMVNQIRASKC